MAALLSAWIFRFSVRTKRWIPVLAALVVVAAWILVLAWKSHIPNRADEEYVGQLSRGLSALIWAAPGHLSQAAPVLFRETFSWQAWGLVTPIALLLSFLGWSGFRGARFPVATSLSLAAFAPLVLGLAAYAVHWDPATLALATWNRLLLQGSVPAALLFSMALRGAAHRGGEKSPRPEQRTRR